jgi:hypothetical protein
MVKSAPLVFTVTGAEVVVAAVMYSNVRVGSSVEMPGITNICASLSVGTPALLVNVSPLKLLKVASPSVHEKPEAA